MDSDSWAARLSSASKRNLFNSQSRSVGMRLDGIDAEMLMAFEEIDMDDDIREEYSCPFCSEYFDILGLCCHMDDEHSVEAKNGMCPVCAMMVDVDMDRFWRCCGSSSGVLTGGMGTKMVMKGGYWRLYRHTCLFSNFVHGEILKERPASLGSQKTFYGNDVEITCFCLQMFS
ncbi:unnamed protein product [Fraxinus pennsylvanica]|uniref:Di19 zinc-binding domain-containing protein n=1 Tax=Fraxinus pennsylvanica TaxID=56036 RepID=A0AAD2DS36_9LAMI|nr:unnamed protein product [Fraxinus pennsylvanica]